MIVIKIHARFLPLFATSIIVCGSALLFYSRSAAGANFLRGLKSPAHAFQSQIALYSETSRQPNLDNRGRGIVHPVWVPARNRPEWFWDLPFIVYNRFIWAKLAPTKGCYDFRELKQWIKKQRKQGHRIAFGVMSSSYGEQATPEWVFQEGVPYVIHIIKGKAQKDPIYWDERYLKIYRDFVHTLGEALRAEDGIEFIDMRGIGVWGEMHLGTFLKGFWSKSELQSHRFTQALYEDAYRDMMDAYREAFPNTQLFLNISPEPDYKAITDYAITKKIGLRFDGLTAQGDNPVSSIFQKSYHRIPCCYEFKSLETNIDSIVASLNRALDDHASYLHCNFGEISRDSKLLKTALLKVARYIGYRFVLRKIVVEDRPTPSNSSVNSFLAKLFFENEGVAPIHRPLAIEFTIIAADGHKMARFRYFPATPSTAWLPGEEVEVTHEINIPRDIPSGDYALTFKLVNSANPLDEVKIANIEAINGRYLVTNFSVQHGINAEPIISIPDSKSKG